MAKIETAIRDAIARGARKQIRLVAKPLRREVRRLRAGIGQLRQEVTALREVAARWRRALEARPWTPEVSDEEAKAARLSPRLIRKLRTRLGLSQSRLSRLVGVSAAAVVQWERGRSAPSEPNRRALVALRRLGRRDVKHLLAGMREPARTRKGRVRARRRPRRRAARRRK